METLTSRSISIRSVPAALRRLIASLLLAVAAIVLAGTLPAEARTHGYILVDSDTGRVIRASNADVPNHPASLTKMMTLYLLFDALEKGKIHLHDQMKVSAHAARQSPSKLGLSPGETISVEQGILALVTKSANDVAVVMAEFLGGTEPAFAQQMTAKARQLGMRKTMFHNASGLPIQGQWSTPRDMAILARALIKNHAREYHYFATREFDFDGQTIASHNHLLGNYPGADGIKTGYIASSGFNLVASAKRDGHRLIGVVFGGNTVRSRDRQMVALLDAGFAAERGPRIEVAKAEAKDDMLDEDANAPQPASEAEAEDAQVSAVVQAMASKNTTAADTQDAQEVGAGDAEDPPWAIQLGSFSQRVKAEQVANVTAKHLGDVVADGHVDVAATRYKHKTLYRALVVGLEKSDAYQACKALRHQRTPCRVIKTDLDVAQR
jgi:D-alanyl-D-alanine carboxypeptidase